MENYTGATVIKDVSESLKELVRTNIAELSKDDAILFDSPADFEFTQTTKLLIYLFQVNENHYLRNAPPKLSKADNKFVLLKAPLAVDLFYMFVPYAKYRETELVIIDKLKRLFYISPVLKNDLLQGSLSRTGNDNLSIVPENPPIHEIRSMWSDFAGRPHKLTLFYLVTPVRIPAMIMEDANLVTQANVDYKLKSKS